MTGAFIRDRLPDWQAYADREGIVLHGRGVEWRSAICDFHDDGKPSMRVNLKTGGWICMSCGTKGGDVLSHYMQRTMIGFVQAARDLGAWDESMAPQHDKPRLLSEHEHGS